MSPLCPHQNAQKTNDSGKFVEFTLSAILEAVESQAAQINEQLLDSISKESYDGIKDGLRDGISVVQKKTLGLMSENPHITIEMLATQLGINRRNTEKNIKTLRDLELVARAGARKNGYWKVL